MVKMKFSNLLNTYVEISNQKRVLVKTLNLLLFITSVWAVFSGLSQIAYFSQIDDQQLAALQTELAVTGVYVQLIIMLVLGLRLFTVWQEKKFAYLVAFSLLPLSCFLLWQFYLWSYQAFTNVLLLLRAEYSNIGIPPFFNYGISPESFVFLTTLLFITCVWEIAVLITILFRSFKI